MVSLVQVFVWGYYDAARRRVAACLHDVPAQQERAHVPTQTDVRATLHPASHVTSQLYVIALSIFYLEMMFQLNKRGLTLLRKQTCVPPYILRYVLPHNHMIWRFQCTTVK